MSGSVDVTYCVLAGEHFECVAEPATDDEARTLRDFMDEEESFTGELVITSDGNPDVRVRDSMNSLASQVCFEANPAIRAGEPVTIQLSEVAASVRFDPIDTSTIVSGDGIPSVKLSRAELADALWRAGERYLAFIANTESDPRLGPWLAEDRDEALDAMPTDDA
jgi:hypothetical protein